MNYYYTFTDKTNHTFIFISAYFENGLGLIYASIVNSDDNVTKYPSHRNFDVKSTYTFLGQGLNINTKLMHQKCTSSLCKILISLYGISSYSNDAVIHVKLNLDSNDKKISENKPFKSYIRKREQQYFSIYLKEPLKSISVSLTNLDGDADLMMNYGKNNYPTFYNTTWKSSTMQSEFIDIDKNNEYFQKKNLQSIEGWYTIGVFGIRNTTYILHVSTHPKRVVHVNNYFPTSCKREVNSQSYCHFRYNDFYLHNKTKPFDLIIWTEYLYGSGVIYATLKDLEDYQNFDFYEDLPSKEKYEFSSLNTTRNQLYISSKLFNH